MEQFALTPEAALETLGAVAAGSARPAIDVAHEIFEHREAVSRGRLRDEGAPHGRSAPHPHNGYDSADRGACPLGYRHGSHWVAAG